MRGFRLAFLLLLLVFSGSAAIGPWARLSNAGSTAAAQAVPHFSDPISVAVGRQGNVFVFDRGMRSVDKLSSTGDLVSRWPVPVSRVFPGPGRLTVDRAGNLYILLGNTRQNGKSVGRIGKLSPSGQVVARWSSPALLNAGAVAAQPNGALFVAVATTNRAGNPSGQVVTVSPQGRVTRTWQIANPGYDFLSPEGIATDGRGNLYVSGIAGSCNRGCQGGQADVIERLAPAGPKPLKVWTYTFGSVVQGPGLAVDGRGNAYAAGGLLIARVGPNGKVRARWGYKVGCGSFTFRNLTDLALDAQADVYVVDEGNRNLQKGTSTGLPLATWGGCPSTTPPPPIPPGS